MYWWNRFWFYHVCQKHTLNTSQRYRKMSLFAWFGILRSIFKSPIKSILSYLLIYFESVMLILSERKCIHLYFLACIHKWCATLEQLNTNYYTNILQIKKYNLYNMFIGLEVHGIIWNPNIITWWWNLFHTKIHVFLKTY